MLRDPRIRRIVWLATGVAWAVSSLVLAVAPTYWEPSTVLDWAAVLAYTAAWLLFAPSILLLGRLVEARLPHLLGTAIAGAAVVTGVANLAEDALGIAGASTWYVYAILIATVLLVPLAYAFARERAMRLSVLALGFFLGIGFVQAIGGVVVLILFAALSLRTDWFAARVGAARTEPAT